MHSWLLCWLIWLPIAISTSSLPQYDKLSTITPTDGSFLLLEDYTTPEGSSRATEEDNIIFPSFGTTTHVPGVPTTTKENDSTTMALNTDSTNTQTILGAITPQAQTPEATTSEAITSEATISAISQKESATQTGDISSITSSFTAATTENGLHMDDTTAMVFESMKLQPAKSESEPTSGIKETRTFENNIMRVQGMFHWTDPNGVKTSISYIADENGYRAFGDAVPTPWPLSSLPVRLRQSIELNLRIAEEKRRRGVKITPQIRKRMVERLIAGQNNRQN